MSYSLNSSKGGYMGYVADDIGEHYRGHQRDAKSLDYIAHIEIEMPLK